VNFSRGEIRVMASLLTLNIINNKWINQYTSRNNNNNKKKNEENIREKEENWKQKADQ